VGKPAHNPARDRTSLGLWLLVAGGGLAILALAVGVGRPPAKPPPAAAAAPAFDAAAAFADLKLLCDLGPRHHRSLGHAACRRLIETRLREAGVEVRIDQFPYTGLSGSPEPFTNLFGRFGPPRSAETRPPPSAAPVLIGTHFDTQARCHADPDPAKRDRPVPGANDGGSGTAVLLELVRRFRGTPPPVPVILAFYDGEDFGGPGELAADYMVGSKYHAGTLAAAAPQDRPAAVVIVDLVGERDAEFPRRHDFQAAAPGLTDAVWGAAARRDARPFVNSLAGSVTDDHSAFLALGIPALLVIDLEYGPRNAWWHTSDDTIDKCDAATLGAVGQVLLDWVYAGAPRGS
jgi:hypothetical protein